MITHTYRNPRSLLTVESLGAKKLGNCYHSYTYRVTTGRRRKMEQLRDIIAGAEGLGQSFEVHSQCDGLEAAAGVDSIPCLGIDEKGEVVENPGINPYSREPYGPMDQPFFVYTCETRVDSGD